MPPKPTPEAEVHETMLLISVSVPLFLEKLDLNARSAMVTEPVGDTETPNSSFGFPFMVTCPAPGPRMESCLPIFSQLVKRIVPCNLVSKVMVLPAGAVATAQRSDPVPLSCKVVTRVGSGGS